uniref:Uncharacterized protein n=1 Tax=Psilocybe cubensis TaxID=181762 RepID=A0A8H7Y0G4_PSICU
MSRFLIPTLMVQSPEEKKESHRVASSKYYAKNRSALQESARLRMQKLRAARKSGKHLPTQNSVSNIQTTASSSATSTPATRTPLTARKSSTSEVPVNKGLLFVDNPLLQDCMTD